MGVSINGGTPIAGWFIRQNPIEMDDDWGYPYDSGNHHMDIEWHDDMDDMDDMDPSPAAFAAIAPSTGNTSWTSDWTES